MKYLLTLTVYSQDLIYSQVERILNLSCDNIKLWVFVSVDALDDKAEYIRGVSKAGEKSM